MAACPACTFINADDANACEMCGAQLGTPTAVKACAHCTLENAADASACVACGAWRTAHSARCHCAPGAAPHTARASGGHFSDLPLHPLEWTATLFVGVIFTMALSVA